MYARERVQEARDRQARYSSDRQRFIEEWRLELTKQIAGLHDELATQRRSLGLSPSAFPLERKDEKEPLSPPTPIRSTATTHMASSGRTVTSCIKRTS